VSRSTSGKNIADRSVGYNVYGEVVDGNDVLAVCESTKKAVKRAKKGNGPTLLECNTYRWFGHGMYDTGYVYRTREEVEEWKQKCPIERLRKKILEEQLVTEAELDHIEKEIQAVIEQSVDYAKKGSYPTWDSMVKMLYT